MNYTKKKYIKQALKVHVGMVIKCCKHHFLSLGIRMRVVSPFLWRLIFSMESVRTSALIIARVGYWSLVEQKSWSTNSTIARIWILDLSVDCPARYPLDHRTLRISHQINLDLRNSYFIASYYITFAHKCKGGETVIFCNNFHIFQAVCCRVLLS